MFLHPPAFLPHHHHLVHVHGSYIIYKLFGIPTNYTILNLPLSILYQPFMVLIPCTFSPIPLLLLPTGNPPCDLHFSDSVPVLVVCLAFVFVFQIQLLIVVSLLFSKDHSF